MGVQYRKLERVRLGLPRPRRQRSAHLEGLVTHLSKHTSTSLVTTSLNIALRFSSSRKQGLTLVHFSAQLERFLWDRGARRGCVARVKGVLRGCLLYVRCFCVSKRLKLS